MSVNKTEIRENILKFRHFLDNLKYDQNNKIDIAYSPVKEFENKYEYPLTFQIFMEEIGEFEISQLSNGVLLRIEKPFNPLNDHSGGFLIQGEFTEIFNQKDNIFLKNVNVVAQDYDGYFYGFTKKKGSKQFIFICEDSEIFKGHDFFKWILTYIFENLENIDFKDYKHFFYRLLQN